MVFISKMENLQFLKNFLKVFEKEHTYNLGTLMIYVMKICFYYIPLSFHVASIFSHTVTIVSLYSYLRVQDGLNLPLSLLSFKNLLREVTDTYT